MPRKESEPVPEGNGPVPQEEEFESGEPTLADLFRLFDERFDIRLKIVESCFDRWDRKLDEMAKYWRNMDQCVASLEHDARQPRLAMEADRQANTKTRERTEGAAKAVQAMHGDSFPARRVDPGPKTNSTSFDVIAEAPAFPGRYDVVIENGAGAPKSCLPSLKMRSPTAAGGLLPTGEASTATRITFNQPPLRFYSTEETDSKTNLKTRILYVSYDSSFLLAAHSCQRVFETKSGENRIFGYLQFSRSSPQMPVFGIVARVALW